VVHCFFCWLVVLVPFVPFCGYEWYKHPHFNGDYIVVLEDGRQLRLSRTRRENLEARLKAVS
jgi:hypothetical protein